VTIQLREGTLACSNCFQAEEVTHVEFPAAWDGPTLNADTTIGTGIEPVAIDELVLCEKCLAVAARLIGLVHAPDLVAELERLRTEKSELAEQLAAEQKALIDLNAANESLTARRSHRSRAPSEEEVEQARERARDLSQQAEPVTV
jgi:hypothetical protein